MKTINNLRAFPPNDNGTEGMLLRDYYAANAPVDYALVTKIFGSGIPNDDKGREVFFSVWALLRHEYADAMLAERSNPDAGGV